MGNLLRERRSASAWASALQVIEVEEKVSSFKGLAAVVEADIAALERDKMPSGWRDRSVSGELQFEFADAEGRVPIVSGRLASDVDAVCQRCLEPFRVRLRIEPSLLLLSADEQIDGYLDYEVWEVEATDLCPQDIVEELLIMAMPFAAKHDNASECGALSTDDKSAEKVTRPFADLRLQMDRKQH